MTGKNRQIRLKEKVGNTFVSKKEVKTRNEKKDQMTKTENK